VQPRAYRRAGNNTLVIVNPNSCSGLTGKNWDSLYAQIKQVLGDDLQVVASKKSGDGTTLARKYLKRGFERIVAIGGDGTLNEVANGFFEEPAGIFRHKALLKPINPDAVMAIVPCGTRNVLARSLGLPQGVVECCRTFSAGIPKKMDVIVATATDAEAALHRAGGSS
jgi:diacylglycerol kinase family enzyme